MKKIFTLIVATVFAATFAHAQTGWVDHKGDNRISLKFPSEPKEVSPGSFAANDRDSVVYVFTIVDFIQVAGIDSVALAPIKNTPEFAAQMKTGINQSLPNVTFDDFKINTWKGFTSYSTTGVDPAKKKYDMFMVLIGNKLYSFSTVRSDGTDMAGHDKFINSIALSN
ncbi:MAG: hypothetical protein ACHQHN_12975 [Sphingobacteriales bacterium]